MALTVGTTSGFRPYSARGSGGQSGKNIINMHVADAQTIEVGDVLTFAAGVVTVDNTAPASNIVGIAMEDKTAVASTTFADKVAVCLATQDQLFIGSFVTAAATDISDSALADLTVGADGKDIAAADAGGWPVIEDTTGDETVELLAFADEQFKGVPYKTATVNPRVIFRFNPIHTIFFGIES